jgi:hypothetical protein
MKKLVYLILLFSFQFSFSQSPPDFEGKITYRNDYFSATGREINKYLGDTVIAYIKKGNYKQVYPTTSLGYSIIYIQKKNLYYNISQIHDTILYEDCFVKDDTVVSTHRTDSITKILGYNCKKVEFIMKKKTITYFYAEQLPINPAYFEKHNKSCYNEYADLSKSIYLKTVISYPDLILTMTAIKIEKKKIKNSEFKLPEKTLLKIN